MNKKDMLLMMIRHYSRGNKAQFAKIIGVTPQTISTWLVRDTFDREKIYANCEDINPDWLLTGEGEMLRHTTVMTKVDDGSGIPLVPIAAMAGQFQGSQTVMERDCERYVVPAFRSADFLIRVSGDSMQPRYFAGDIVACKRLSLTDVFWQWGKTYVIDTDQGALIKRVEPGNSPESVTIVSENSVYKAFELPVTAIYHVALVTGLIRCE